MNTRKKPTKKQLIKLYLKNKLSIRKIAIKFDCCSTTIRKQLVSFNIKRRRNNEHYHDLNGKICGKLKVLHVQPNSYKNRRIWRCECQCGNLVDVQSDRLVTASNNTSCGICSRIGQNNGNWKGYKGLGIALYNRYKTGAKLRNIKFDISIQDMYELLVKQNFKCALSGLQIQLYSRKDKKQKFTQASLDRIDSNKGYVKDNIQWVVVELNLMKGAKLQEDFIYLCTQVGLNNQ